VEDGLAQGKKIGRFTFTHVLKRPIEMLTAMRMTAIDEYS